MFSFLFYISVLLLSGGP